jgi:general secretion pathway protein B
MSYILDALKRAERERSASAPEYGSAAPAPVARGLRPTTIALAGASLFLAGIGVAALLLRAPAQTGPGPIQATVMPGPLATAPAMATAPAPAAAPDAIQQPLLEGASELTEYETLDDVSPVFQGSAPVPADAAGTTDVDPIATLVDGRPGRGPDTTATTQSAGSPGNPADQAPARDLPPRLAEMPESFQSRFPAPVIQVHVFDAEPSRRWVMVENRRQGEGGVLGSGLVIAEIVSDGVIFEFAGSRVYWPLNR